LNYSEFVWKLFGSGYRLLRFFDRAAANKLKPRKSLINLHPLKSLKAERLLQKSDRLHLGCGPIRLEGFINIDAVFTPAIDFRCRLNKLYDYFPENSVSEIYVCHTMEHLPARFLLLYLKQFHYILKKGGILRISVPDVEKCLIAAKKQRWSDAELDLLQGVMAIKGVWADASPMLAVPYFARQNRLGETGDARRDRPNSMVWIKDE